MAAGKAFKGKPYAGNPRVAPSQCHGAASRFDEGYVALAATPRCGRVCPPVASQYLATVRIFSAVPPAGNTARTAHGNVPRDDFRVFQTGLS